MNAAVIIKIEYQLPGEENFTELDFVPHTGKMVRDSNKTDGGNVLTEKIDFLIAGINPETDELMKLLNFRKCYFRITDADSIVYLVGDESFPARLSPQMDFGGTPGSFKGYRCTIVHNSVSGCQISNS